MTRLRVRTAGDLRRAHLEEIEPHVRLYDDGIIMIIIARVRSRRVDEENERN